MRSQVSGNRAAALVLALFVLMFLAVFGAALVVMIFSKMHSATMAMDRLKAFYLAEAGIAKALNEVKKNEDFHGDGIGAIPETSLGEGTYKVEHDIEQKVFISTGEVNANKRVIFIKYESRVEE